MSFFDSHFEPQNSEIRGVMVEQNEEGEKDALVNNAGLKECSEGEGTCEGVIDSQETEKEREKKRGSSCCGASLGAICCRSQRGKDNKGKYVACHLSYEWNFLCTNGLL